MPMLSRNLSAANDNLSQAIAFTQLALDQARNELADRHLLAIKETRINGLIDIVRYETRIQEALYTLKAICSSPGVGLAGRDPLPAGDRAGDDAVDGESGGGNELAGPRSSDGAAADDPFAVEVPAGVQLGIPDLHCGDREPSIAVET